MYCISASCLETTGSGSITVSGTGGGAGSGISNYGVAITGSGGTIKTTGSGGISVTGIGGNITGSGGSNYGVYCDTGNCIRTTGGTPGNISIIGTGGNGSGSGTDNYGVSIYNSTVAISGAANSNISITGTGGASSGNSNYGILGGYITTTGTGTVTLIGTGGGVTNSGTDFGIIMNGGITSTVNGLLTVTGTGGGAGSGANNRGVYISSSDNIKTTGTGNIIVNGIRGGGNTSNNYGLRIFSSNAIRTTGSGNITINTDTISLNEADDINSVGALTIAPYTASSTVGVNGGTGILDLSTTYLGYLTSTSLQIGNSSQTGTTTLGAYASWAKPISFVTHSSGSTAVSGAQTNSSTFSFTGSATLSANITSSALTIVSGTFNAGAQTITLTGPGTTFSNTGTFTAGTSTIKINTQVAGTQTFAGGGGTYYNFEFNDTSDLGPTLNITGSNTFNNFKDNNTSVSSHTLVFSAGSTTTISSLTMNGPTNVALTSSTPGSYWNLVDTTGTNTVSYVSITDSCASGGATWDASNGTNTNGGHNCGWTFTLPISIAGTANGNNAATVKIAVNGNLQGQTAVIGGGTWSISGVSAPTSNDIITVWVHSVADALESTAVTKYSTGNITGMVLNTNVLSLGSNQNTSLSVTNLGLYDANDNEDIMHTSNSGALLVQGASNSYTDETLSILASNTLTANSSSSETVTTEKINNAGTITSTNSPTYTLAGTSGTLFTNSGTFTADTSTVNVSGNGTAAINSSAIAFYDLTSSGTGTKSFGAGTVTINHALAVNAGTLQVGDYYTYVPGTITINNGGTLNGSSGGATNEFRGAITVNNGGAWTSTGNANYRILGGLTVNSTSTFSSGSGTYTFDTTAQTIGGTQSFTITNIFRLINSAV